MTNNFGHFFLVIEKIRENSNNEKIAIYPQNFVNMNNILGIVL